MNRSFLCLAAIISAAVTSAAEPVFNIAANEGSGNVLQNSGTAAGINASLKGSDLEWGEGRTGGKAIVFMNPVKCRTNGNACAILPVQDKVDFTKPFSVTFWVNISPELAVNSQYTIIGNARGDYGPGWRVIYGWNALRLIAGGGTSKTAASIALNPGKNPHPKGKWHHVAVVYDAGKVTMYLNGIEAGSKEMTLSPGSKSLTIGAYSGGYGYGFRGSLADIKIYDTALTAEELIAEAQGIEE